MGPLHLALASFSPPPPLPLLLQYQVQMGDLQSRTLNLSVWHAEAAWRNVFLGEVEVPLGLWDWTYTQPVWQDLQPRVGGTESLPCVSVFGGSCRQRGGSPVSGRAEGKDRHALHFNEDLIQPPSPLPTPRSSTPVSPSFHSPSPCLYPLLPPLFSLPPFLSGQSESRVSYQSWKHRSLD